MNLSVKLMPRLKLAPKLQRPLSLWNPLDYGRLLYWIFYFPQAFRWYADTFGTGYPPREESKLRKGIHLLRTDPVQRKLWFQGLVLSLVSCLAMVYLWSQLGLPMNSPLLDLRIYVSLIGLLSLLLGLWGRVSEGLICGVGFSIFFGPLLFFWQDSNGPLLRFVVGLGAGIMLSAAEMVTGGIFFSLQTVIFYTCYHCILPIIVLAPALLIGGCIYLIQLLDGNLSLPNLINSLGWLLTTAFMLGGGVAMGTLFFSLRPDTWLIGTLAQDNCPLLFPRNTLLPLPWLMAKLRNHLRSDWEAGLQQCQDLLSYSGQFIPVIHAVNITLAESNESHLIWRVSRLAHHATDWRWVGLVSVSLKAQILAITRQFVRAMYLFWTIDQETRKKLIAQPIIEPMRLDTLPRAAAAGFWYLHEQEPAQAAQAFNVVRHIPYGEEMYAIAHCLNLCHVATSFEQLQAIQCSDWSGFDPSQALRPTTWGAIATLDYVTQEARLNSPTVNENTRAQAIARAQLELHKLLDRAEELPTAEQGLIVAIATTWQQHFDTAARKLKIVMSYF